MDRTEIFFVAGEPSGDLHAAQLAAELLRRGAYNLTGAGGPRMRQAGVHTDLDSSAWATIGLAQAVTKAPILWTALRRLVRLVRQRRPAVLVLVDFGGFNVRVARRVRNFPWHQPIMYYFPPSSWNKTACDRSALAALTDVVATPFPWSEQLLRQDGVNARYVGHPVLDEIAPVEDKSPLRAALGVPPGQRVVGLMPGSRISERSLLAPQMWGAARQLAEHGTFHFLWSPGPPGVRDPRPVPADLAGVFTVVPSSADLVRAADVVIVAFGTATLEAAAALTPMITVYRGTALNHLQAWLQRWPTLYYAMPNIVLDRPLVPELIGRACDAARLAEAVCALLDDPQRLRAMREGLAQCREALGPPGAAGRAADLVEDLLVRRGGAP